MIAPYTVIDCRSHTAWEPYTFDTQEDALSWWASVTKNTVEKDQRRVLVMYQDAVLIKTFTHVGANLDNRCTV